MLTAAQHRPVPEPDIDRMTELCDRWHETVLAGKELPAPLKCINGSVREQPPSITGIEYADPAFQRLALSPEVMRVVNALTGAPPAVSRSVALSLCLSVGLLCSRLAQAAASV